MSGSTISLARRAVDDRRQLLAAGVADDQLEEEAVELRLGQRVRAFLLDRVLRGHHEERLLELVVLAADGDGAFLHRFEQGRLRLGRGAVDFVGQADLREDRPLLKLEEPLAVGRLHHHVRAQDVGRHQVGRELDAREVQVERLGQRAHQQRLAQARHAFQQAVPADEQAGEHAVDDVVVPDDHAADLLADRTVAADKLFRPFLHLFANAHYAVPVCCGPVGARVTRMPLRGNQKLIPACPSARPKRASWPSTGDWCNRRPVTAAA